MLWSVYIRVYPCLCVVFREALLDPLSHLIIGNGNEAANVARIIVHNSTVNFKDVHIRRPVPVSTTRVPLRKPRARHELAWCRAAGATGFRLRLGGGRCAPASIR